MGIKEAIQIAEKCVKKSNVVTTDMHINSANFDDTLPNSHWSITWKLNKPVKGGWFVVHISQDKTYTFNYGE